jgi:hypothetical protein
MQEMKQYATQDKLFTIKISMLAIANSAFLLASNQTVFIYAGTNNRFGYFRIF